MKVIAALGLTDVSKKRFSIKTEESTIVIKTKDLEMLRLEKGDDTFIGFLRIKKKEDDCLFCFTQQTPLPYLEWASIDYQLSKYQLET